MSLDLQRDASPQAAAQAIAERAPGFRPRAALILGSGLAPVAATIADAVRVPYSEIPGFPQPTVEGHPGCLLLGRLSGVPVACLQGRMHLFEGATAQDIRMLVRTMRCLGASVLVLTNAAGSLRPGMDGGSLMMLTDHINMLGMNPLTGPNDDAFGPRFPALADAYDAELRSAMRAAATATGVRLHEGVYLAYGGPSFETAAEIRAFTTLGADAVGMSTVPEAIVARHCGMRIAAISAVVTLAAGLAQATLNHEQTLAIGAQAAESLGRLLQAFFARLPDDA